MRDSLKLLASQMADPDASWSVGTFGAIAEFVRDKDEPAELEISGDYLSVVTRRGGIGITAQPGIRLVASESTTRESWNHRVAVCLPTDQCAMNQNTVLSEIGPDTDALREEDRTSILFDLGLGALQADLCVRVADPDLMKKLRPCIGRSVFESDNPAMAAILAASPHRVFISRLGRIEVFQMIPPPDGKSPEGPHTHVLPKLLKLRRTHAATEPIPDGLVPCFHLYPAHPAKDALGRKQPFSAARHDAFQQILHCYGAPNLVNLKMKVIAAIIADAPPTELDVPSRRFAKTTVRVALRQLHALADKPISLPNWSAVHDQNAEPEPDEMTSEHA
jgi:hypothetical protein